MILNRHDELMDCVWVQWDVHLLMRINGGAMWETSARESEDIAISISTRSRSVDRGAGKLLWHSWLKRGEESVLRF